MFRIRVAAIKSEDNFYAAFVDRGDDPVMYKVPHAGDVETVLRGILEFIYGDCDFNYVCCYESEGWCVYDVEVIDDPYE